MWKFKSKDEAVPEVIKNRKEEFEDEIRKTYDIDKLLVNIGDSIFDKTVPGEPIITETMTVIPEYELSSSYTAINGYLDGITVDYDSDGNGEYTIETDVFGLEAALTKIDISGKDNAYEMAASIGAKFPGGTFYFGYQPYIPNHAKFEILYNVDLVPDDDEVTVEVSFKASYDVTIHPSSSPSSHSPEYVFNIDPALATGLIAVAAIAVVAIGIGTGLITIPAGLLSTLYSGLAAFNILVPATSAMSETDE